MTQTLPTGNKQNPQRQGDPNWAYKYLISVLVGLKFDTSGRPDRSEVQAYIESKGGEFYDETLERRDFMKTDTLKAGKLHFFTNLI